MKNDVLAAFVAFQAVFFLLDLYIYTRNNRDIARKEEYTYFSALIIIHLAYLVLNSAWSLQEYGVIHLSKGLMSPLCMLSLWAVTGCSYAFFRFTVGHILFAPIRLRPVRALCVLPALLSTLLIAASPWTGWIYRLNETNQILHGPLYPVMVVTSSLYLLAVAVIAGINTLRANTRQKRRDNLALLGSVILIIAFVILDDMLTQAAILPAAIFAVIVVIFINMQESNINSDVLTGMNNRRKADDYLTAKLTAVSEAAPLYLYMGDLNGFKGINDAYGHAEGDEALILCAGALKQTIARFNGFAARYGGDEFLLCWQPDHGQDPGPEGLVEDVGHRLARAGRAAGKPYALSMSMGYTRCADRTESPAACIKRADDMLYQRKQAFHLIQKG